MRFHLDEHVAHAIAEGLRQRQIDVSTAAERGLLGVADEQQLEFALREDRVLVTQDRDFLRLHNQGVQHAGIVYCAQGKRSFGDVIRYLCLMHDCMSPHELRGQIEYL